MVDIIKVWMRKFNYHIGFAMWMRLYYISILEFNKNLMVKVF